MPLEHCVIIPNMQNKILCGLNIDTEDVVRVNDAIIIRFDGTYGKEWAKEYVTKCGKDAFYGRIDSSVFGYHK